MKRNDLQITDKYKGELIVSSINIPHKIKFNLEFINHFVLLKLHGSNLT